VLTRRRGRPGSSLLLIGRANLIGDASFLAWRPATSGNRGSSRLSPWDRPLCPGRAFIRGVRLGPTLAELQRELVGVAIQGTVARMGEVALLAFDPAKGSAGLVDLSATTDIELVRLAGRSWMP
jgi:hypothetical protein